MARSIGGNVPAPGPTRRDFFAQLGTGLHGMALAGLLAGDLYADQEHQAGDARGNFRDLKPRPSHFPPRVKAVIQLFMNGGPSQVDLFDPKPMLTKMHGKTAPPRIAGDVSSPTQAGGLLGSPFKFAKHGQSGMDISEALPHLHKHADDLCFIRSMFSVHFNHEPALFLIHSGRTLPGRPSIGAWTVYGLGSVNQNLPAYVVLDDPKGLPVNGTQSWQAGWLPPIFQGTRLRAKGSPILNLKPRVELPDPIVQAERELLRRLDERHRKGRPLQQNLDARIASYELAARMQLSATDALDVNQESQRTRQMYGLEGDAAMASYGRRCLMARRLVERGVRYVQIYIERQIWDSHNNLKSSIQSAASKTDQPVSALLTDLRQRGLLDETLVIWNGEFGRLPIAQLQNGGDLSRAGRDHGPSAFSLWMAGGGVKSGMVYGATDDIGHRSVENRVSVQDLHATILHQLGLNHRDLVYTTSTGRSERITDEFDCRVVHEVLA